MAQIVLARLVRRVALPAAVLVPVLCALAVCVHAENRASSVKISAVRFWSLGDVTRVAIEISGDFKFKTSRLPNPDRLFFDIQDARPEPPIPGMQVIQVGDPLLKQIRVAEPMSGITRVVLDLNQPADYTASQLSNHARVIVELRKQDELRKKDELRRNDQTPPSVSHIVTEHPILHEQSADLPLVIRTHTAKPEPRAFVPPAPAEPKVVTVRSSAPIISGPPASLAMLARPARMPSTSLPRIPPPSAPPAAKTTVPEPAGPVAARQNATGDRSLTRVLGLKLGRVVLDAGHGGQDVGTQGPTGLYEKDLVLDVAKRLGALLEDRLSSEVIYTRSDDTFVGLEERTRIANDGKADLFLSIHANSSNVKSVTGVETYYLSFTTSKTAMDLAARENASSERSIFELKDLLNKIALKDKVDESREFASRLQTSLYAISAKGNAATTNRGIKRAPFVVLIGAHMPSVLAEIGFLTNPADEALLRKGEQRDKIAEALYKGIASYADTLSHFQVAKGQ